MTSDDILDAGRAMRPLPGLTLTDCVQAVIETDEALRLARSTYLRTELEGDLEAVEEAEKRYLICMTVASIARGLSE